MYGFEYIYANGYYNYGVTNTVLRDAGDDSFYSQCSPVLGPTYKFSQANGFRKLGLSLFTFEGWYEYDESQTDKVVFIQYNRAAEGTYINRDIVLYGYYYAVNAPTSIKFYRWNDENRNYIEYPGNKNQYTLRADIQATDYFIDSEAAGGEEVTPAAEGDETPVITQKPVKLKNNPTNYIDENNIAKIKTFNAYGIDSTSFGGQFTENDFSQSGDTLDLQLLERVLQTYWYYRDSYLALYFKEGGTTKRYIRYDSVQDADGIGFYYLNSAGAKVPIVVYSSDMVNFTYLLSDTARENVTGTPDTAPYLEEETLFKYNFVGANLYMKEGKDPFDPNDFDKYFRMYEVTSEMIQDAESTQSTSSVSWFIVNYQPRFYYDMNGKRYYFLARNEHGSRACNTIYYVNPSAAAGSGISYESSANITYLKNYYVNYGSEYFTINYKVYTDGPNQYINPLHDPETNTVTVTTATGDVDCYFNYEEGLLYNVATGQRVSFDHYIYCPINENYKVQLKQSGGSWTTGDITIKSLPSPNINYWYDDDEYGFVGYIMLTDKILESMKKAPSNDATDDGGVIYQTFKTYMQLVYSKSNFAEAKFANSTLYNQFLNGRSLDDAYNEFYLNLDREVRNRILRYDEDAFMSSLLQAERYRYSKEGLLDIIAGVYVNVPITFNNLMTDPRTGEPLNISVTVQNEEPFTMISANTVVSQEDDIYAIPIYTLNVVRFNRSAITTPDTTTVNVDLNKMDIWHFKLSSDSSYVYNRANGDYLKFALLDADQYTRLYEEGILGDKTTLEGTLNSIISSMSTEDKTKFVFTEGPLPAGQEDVKYVPNTLDINLSNCTPGRDYVLVAYYNISGIDNEDEAYVVRVSDNVVHIVYTASGATCTVSSLKNVVDPVV